MHSRILRATLALSLALVGACASPPPSPAVAKVATVEVPLYAPLPELLTAGQPTASDWAGIAAQGVATVINLRPEAEMQGRDEAAEVAAAGMQYLSLPVAGAADLDADNATRLRELLAAASGKVLLHCASANRAGALLALAQMQTGMDPEQALQLGRDAGMRSTEARVRELLQEAPIDTCLAAACP
ncbi:beta-lactamase hydrolase domain-containing protein [Pseudoxanthomonas kalamensis]|uniref:beta-lactamase hydrolase domain-containing protein n=1 Tax=Pseudoxanthomonas kalamensis TaxID=289483 RepID=UPI0013918A00|nr:sulfur transferase domain-containing protein [Pseudoxanthomonas kalamensis]